MSIVESYERLLGLLDQAQIKYSSVAKPTPESESASAAFVIREDQERYPITVELLADGEELALACGLQTDDVPSPVLMLLVHHANTQLASAHVRFDPDLETAEVVSVVPFSFLKGTDELWIMLHAVVDTAKLFAAAVAVTRQQLATGDVGARAEE